MHIARAHMYTIRTYFTTTRTHTHTHTKWNRFIFLVVPFVPRQHTYETKENSNNNKANFSWNWWRKTQRSMNEMKARWRKMSSRKSEANVLLFEIVQCHFSMNFYCSASECNIFCYMSVSPVRLVPHPFSCLLLLPLLSLNDVIRWNQNGGEKKTE